MTHGRAWIVCGAILGGLAVALGAFHAHGLEAKITADLSLHAAEFGVQGATEPGLTVPRLMENFAVAVRYQMFHSLAILLVGILAGLYPSRLWSVAALLMFLGVAIFCGCLYAIVFTQIKMLGAIVPIGGLAFILGWIVLAVAAAKIRPTTVAR